MLSRVAENLYWISRYVERAEGIARLLEDAYFVELETESQSIGGGPLENVLLMLNGQAAFAQSIDLTDPPTDGGYLRSLGEHREAIVRFLTFDRGHDISIRETIGYARENARGTQETFSGEAWSQLNKLHLYMNSARAASRFAASPTRFLNRIRRECVLFGALVDDTLPKLTTFCNSAAISSAWIF
jgi:uncharacterized alpha-E superfamily protein